MKSSHLFLLLSLSLISGTCFAHTGEHSLIGFAAGFTHPLAGSDHVFAMLGVGLWTALLPGARWRLPVAFMGAMLLGGLLGAAGWQLTGIEAGVAASVVVLGLLVAGRARPALPIALALTGLFGLFHGFAHGAEAGGADAFAAYAAGFTAATGTLHLCGILLGRGLYAVPALYRVLGGAAAAWGAFLLLQIA